MKIGQRYATRISLIEWTWHVDVQTIRTCSLNSITRGSKPQEILKAKVLDIRTLEARMQSARRVVSVDSRVVKSVEM